MRITKHGHCCLSIVVGETHIVTDPGTFIDPLPLELAAADIVVITHEHADHVHVPSVVVLQAKNPALSILCNQSVATLLAAEGITATVLEGRDSMTVAGVYLEAFDAPHAEIFEAVGQVQNTGYFITERLFYPGDAYGEPGKPVEILALPVGGPWCRLTDALHYALRVAPTYAFPVHDGIEREDRVVVHHSMAERILGERGITFTSVRSGEELVY